MKYLIVTFASVIFLFSCANNQTANEENAASETMMHQQQSAKDENKFADVQFALDKDPVCQMPLSAGISDTAVIDGKTYGFCATECKETYVKEHRK